MSLYIPKTPYRPRELISDSAFSCTCLNMTTIKHNHDEEGHKNF